VLGLLFGGGLTIGTLLICWNALVSADLLTGRPAAPPVGLSELASPTALPPVGPDASGVAEAALEPASPAEEPAQPAEAVAATAPVAVALPELSPKSEALAEAPQSRADTTLAQLAHVLADSAPVALPEPVLTPAPPSRADQAPSPQSALREGAETQVASAVIAPEPAPLPEAHSIPVTAEPPVAAALLASDTSGAASPPAVQPEALEQPPLEPIAAASETPVQPTGTPVHANVVETGATESLPPATTPEPEFTGLSDRAAAVVAPRDLPTSRQVTAAPKRTRAPAKPRTRAKPSLRVPFAGAWATSAEACTPQGQQEGHLVTHITTRRARAGDTSCTFRKIRRNGGVWDVAAMCSDGETRWTSDVQLAVSRNSLTWTSHKGTTNYVRCRRG
jgi:hypothetical protein